MATPSTQLLNYAPPPKRDWKRFRRVVARTLVFVAAAVGYWKRDYWLVPAWERVQLLYWQRQCMAYAAPADQVAYAKDLKAVARLPVTRFESVPDLTEAATMPADQNDGQPGGNIQTQAAFVPRCLTELDEVYDSMLLRRTTALSGGGLFQSVGGLFQRGGLSIVAKQTLFLHERRTPGGITRLINVELLCEGGGSVGTTYDLLARTWEHVGVRGDVIGWEDGGYSVRIRTDADFGEAIRAIARDFDAETPGAGQLVFYEGQVDPEDPSRFTIRYRFGPRDAYIDGWLEDNPNGPVLHVAPRSAETMPRRLQVTYGERCARYAAPADEIVFENDPFKADALLKHPGYVRAWNQAATVARAGPDAWSDLFPAPVARIYLHSDDPRPALFLHERCTPAGVRRIVKVDLLGRPGGDLIGVTAGPEHPNRPGGVYVTLIEPATATTPLAVVGEAEKMAFFSTLETPCRFFAGRADPKDAARFTVGLEIDGRRVEVVGRLADDGESVRFSHWPGQIEEDEPAEGALTR